MPIKTYPLFGPLDIDDKSVFDKAFAEVPPIISEFTFTNLFAWREAYQLKVSVLDGLVILRSDSGKISRFFHPIGSGDIKETVKKVLNESGGVFIRLPEETGVLFDNDSWFRLEPDIDNFDYLFKREDLAALAGRKYDGKRNLIKKFKAVHDYEYIKLDSGNVQECLEFEEKWCSVKDCDGVEGLRNERRAIKEMIKYFSGFNLRGAAIKINGETRAVAIGEALNKNTFVIHILKADPGIQGLYQVMSNEFVLRETRGFEYINMEQDLGVEGLRKAKSSYHPSDMVRKYTLRLLK